jgi:hypothetical protein
MVCGGSVPYRSKTETRAARVSSLTGLEDFISYFAGYAASRVGHFD